MIFLSLSIIFLSVAIMLISITIKSNLIGKVVSLNSITSYITVAAAILSIAGEDKIFLLDVSIIYASLGFVSSIAFLKFLQERKR